MSMKPFAGVLMIAAAIGLIGLSQSMFTVDQTEQALVLQLGQPVGDIKQPGLHFKLPLVQDVRRFDRRILSVDPQPQQMVISSSRDNPLASGADRAFAAALEEAAAPDTPAVTGGGRSSAQTSSGEPIMINTFARYRITDPLEFMKTLRTIDAANQRLEGIMNDATRGVLGNSTLRQLLSEDRTRIMADIRTRVNRTITEGQLGIEIIDIRIVRADLTTDLRQSTVRRMISELQERATQTRAMGAEKAQEIRATAEKEREILLAEARRDAQILRGEGDKEAIGIYATAFNKDKDFYGFTRSLEAYRETMANPETRLILSPDSSFFKHFGNSR
ncbi:MAG: protease modulator HflC [Alphaproteobacteria bacterium]|nr:protease modulator HflC [Alphaproteobacteria bacterium]